jgi:hypothetical protein
LELVADPDDFRPVGEKAEEVGYNAEYGRQLTRDYRFSEWTRQRTREMVAGKLHQVYRMLVRDAVAEDGEAMDRHRAAKIVLQATGDLSPTQVNVDVGVAVLQLPERLAKHLDARRSMLREVSVQEHKGNGSNGNGGAE